MDKVNILKKKLKSHLWTDKPEVINSYLHEQRGNLSGKSRLLLKPKNTQDVSEIIKICNKYKISIIPQGGRTGLCGGTVPSKVGNEVLITTEKMNKIINVDEENFNIVAQSGCSLISIKNAAQKAERFFPITLPSQESCTIGGNISTNAGGSSVLKYGMTKDLVLGLEVVMPNGDILNSIKEIKKDNRGFDPQTLHIGAEGTLGIITAAKLKLFPTIKDKAMAIVALRHIQDAVKFLAMVKDLCFEYLSSFEINSNIGMELIKKHFLDISIPFENKYSWYIILELSSNEKIFLENKLDSILEKALLSKTIVDAIKPQNIKQYNNIWNTREYLSQAQKINGPSIKHDISIPIKKISYFLKEVELRLSKIPKKNLLAFGHLADGNLHFNVSKPIDVNKSNFKKLKTYVNKTIFDLVYDLNGSFSAEHGIGKIKINEFKKYSSNEEFMLKKKLKKLIDPNNIMNPGKIFK